MQFKRLTGIWLALGAFGGELVLLLALPAIGRLHGAAAVAMLSIATVAANGGKLLGCLKIDAALANVDDERLGATHAAALVAIGASTLTCIVLFGVLDALSLVPKAAGAIGTAICAAFAGGAIQQSATMRLLRENRLGTFASMKSLPSLMLVVFVFAAPAASLLDAYVVSWAACSAVVAALYLRQPGSARAGLWARLRGELSASRSFIVKGAPAAALDAGNLFFMSVLTVAVAGADAAGEAAQLQRIALGPSLAASLLLGQLVWRRRYATDDVAAWSQDRRRMVRWTAGAASVSALLACGLLYTRWGYRLVPVKQGDVIAVVACLAPLLAQYTGSPLTVYFFKREKLHMYAQLQVAIFLSLLLVAAASSLLPVGGARRDLLLLLLASVILSLTVSLSRRAVAT